MHEGFELGVDAAVKRHGALFLDIALQCLVVCEERCERF